MALKQESDLTSYGCPKCGWRIDLHRQQPPPANCLYCGKQLAVGGTTEPGDGLPIGTQFSVERQEAGVWWGCVIRGDGKSASARRTDLVELLLELVEKGRALG